MEPDWKALERKLKRGKSLEQAAEEAGLGLDEAKAWLEKRRESAPFDDDTLRIAAAEALHYGLKRLILASKDPRRIKTDDSGEMGSTTFETTDVDAAKALVKFALDSKKLLGAQKEPGAGKREPGSDLFDSPWAFKDE